VPVVIDGLNEPSPNKRENGIFNVLIELDVVIRSEELLFNALDLGREIKMVECNGVESLRRVEVGILQERSYAWPQRAYRVVFN